MLELLRSLFTGDAPAAALSGVLGLLPRLDKEPGADRIKILSIVLEFRKAMDAGDYQACVDLYLQAVEAALGPLPPLPAGSSRR
ncbi:hypothetical protein DRJ54_03105 [Candidatus Acetothermia bacterium]|nr:MAG: hypothetical protein DRJ54_03105 [Candidatus Acetothermia bacterium]